MIDRGEVLGLVDKDEWKLWVCSSEQCGHVYLVVIVKETRVGRADGCNKDAVGEFADEGGGGLVEGGEEGLTFNKPSCRMKFSTWHISKRLGEGNGGDGVPEDFPGFALVTAREGFDFFTEEVLCFAGVYGQVP
jgi:hypothetical protein